MILSRHLLVALLGVGILTTPNSYIVLVPEPAPAAHIGAKATPFCSEALNLRSLGFRGFHRRWLLLRDRLNFGYLRRLYAPNPKKIPDPPLDQPHLSGAGFTVVPEIQSIDKPDSAIFDHMFLPWNPVHYLIARTPIVVGEVENKSAFSDRESTAFAQDMPVKFPGSTELTMPIEFAQFRETIQRILDYEAAINPDVVNYYAYIRVDRRTARAGSTQRVGGIHVDGLQGARYKNKFAPGQTYLVSDALPTVFYVQPFDFSALDVNKDNFFSAMADQADESKAFAGKPYQIILIDPYVAHRSAIAQEDTPRIFFSLQFTLKKFDRIGNTHNPLLDHDWDMVPRPIASDLRHVIFPTVNLTQIDLVIQTLQAVVKSKKGPGEVGPLKWPVSITENGVRKDAIAVELHNNRAAYRAFFETFHNKVYLEAKEASGVVYARLKDIPPERIQALVESHVLKDTPRTRDFIQRYHRTQHFKILKEDIADIQGFADAFGVAATEISNLTDRAIVLHSLFGLWGEINQEIDEKYASEEIKAGYRKYLEDIQIAGLTNIMAILKYNQLTGNKMSINDMLDLMNAGYSLDNPDNPFSKLKLNDPHLQSPRIVDWNVIKLSIAMLGLEQELHSVLQEGRRQFEGAANPKPWILRLWNNKITWLRQAA